MQDLIEDLKGALIARIQERVKEGIRPKVDEIVNQEVAAFGLRLSRHIEFHTREDKVVIEIHRSEAQVKNGS